jgi:hypothetical protein
MTPISPQTVASYAPWGNAQLVFEVGTSAISEDPETGNPIQGIERLEYLAAISLESPNWQPQPGADNTSYSCRGRLLSPSIFDSRITNGTQAQANINGAIGRFELTFDLGMDAFHRRDLRQVFLGTFRLIGGAE